MDVQHRSLGQFFQDEIAAPLGLDVYIRLPEEIPSSRLATLATPSPFKMLLDFPIHLTLDGMNRHSNIYRVRLFFPDPIDRQASACEGGSTWTHVV